jgi:hypothetical protein
LTVTAADAVLLAGTESTTVVETVAVFVTVVFFGEVTVATIVTVAFAPLASEPRWQATVPFAPTGGVVQLPWLVLALTKRVCAGSGSVTVVFEAAHGP